MPQKERRNSTGKYGKSGEEREKRGGKKGRRKSTGSSRRLTEDDEERTSRGKEIAAAKGLKWTKHIPSTTGSPYTPVLRDDSHLAQQEVAFLDVGRAQPTHAYDVGGDWKLLYKKPGDDGPEKPIGPGIKPRTPKSSPKPSPKLKRDKLPPPMKIYVRRWDGPRLALELVKPSDTIDTIQRRLEKEHKIPRKQQRLRFGNEPLDRPSNTLKDHNIRDSDTLDLDPMVIHVREPYSNKKHTLVVDPRESIDEIKDKVEDETGIPKKDQILTFKKKPLDDDYKTLQEYGIKHQDTLDLEPMEIKVRTPDGRITPLIVDPDDTINDVKKQVEKKLGIPPKDQRPTFKGEPLPDNSTLDDNDIHHGDIIDLTPMKIRVRAPDGRTCELDVSPEDTIPEIKDRVEDELGIPPKDQRPEFKGRPLPDDSNLKDNKIKHGDTIDLGPMEIKVRTPEGDIIPLIVNPDDTIEDVKDQVSYEAGILPEEQRPTFKGRPIPDRSTLDDNNIRHGDVIDLSPMEIKVKAPDGRVANIPVTPNDTIEDVKDKVEDQLGIPVEDQRPTFNKKPLEDDTTLRDNGIKHGDTIKLKPFRIYVTDLDRNTEKYDCSPTDTIADIKSRIAGNTGIKPDDQRLFFKGTPLNDNRTTLADNGIQHEDELILEPFTIHVRLPGGKKLTFNVNPRTTNPHDVKNLVQKSEGIMPSKQILKHKGKDLDNPDSLQDNGVQHNDTIDLRMKPVIKLEEPPKRDLKKYLDPDRYGKVTVTTYKTRYDGEPGESVIDGKIKEETTNFKWETHRLRDEEEEEYEE